jgi:hypothetical protein
MQKRILGLLVQLLEENMVRTATLEAILQENISQRDWKGQTEAARYVAREILTKDVSSPLTYLKAAVESLPDDK